MNAPALRSQMFEALIRAAWLTVLDQACRADSPVPKVAHKPKVALVGKFVQDAEGLVSIAMCEPTVPKVAQPQKPPRARKLSRP